MKDIDFDELDKAVNSLMGNMKDQPDQSAPKTLNISTTLKENELPEYTKLEQVAQKIGSETIGGPTERTAILPDTSGDDPLKTIDLTVAMPTGVPTPSVEVAPLPETSLAISNMSVSSESPAQAATPLVDRSRPIVAPRRSAGRFMDVMHPSSDMKTATPAVAPSAAPSRQAQLVTPPVRSAEVPVSVSAAAEPQVASSPTTSEPIEAAMAAAMTSESTEPLSSPFLPDAKVEKRPLGTPSTDVFEATDAQSEPGIGVQEKDAQLAPDATQSVEELPAELHNDLLAIETNLAVEDADFSAEQAAEPTIAADTPVVAPEAPSGSAGPASIPQQYKELPSSGDQTSGAIFDVEDYHKQPAHPAKSNKSWLWIVLIIVIIVISAAGGAAFYLLSAK